MARMYQTKSADKPRQTEALTVLLSNGLILAIGAWAWIHSRVDPPHYKALLQEDGPLEWATVIAFLAATGLAGFVAWKQWRQDARLPWYLVSVALFCFVVAGEEVSWGQRLMGYQPPEYFLANNFQQELNVHNVIETSTRKLAVKGVILGYGVLLALLGAPTGLRRRLRSWGIEPSPAYLAPSFFVTFWLYQSYPLELTGEVVELMLGFGFLLSLFEIAQRFEPRKSSNRLRSALAFSWAATLLIGFAVPGLTIAAMGVDATKIRAAEREVGALRLDFLTLSGRSDRLATKCGQHKRVYSYVEKNEESGLLEHTFAALQQEGLDEQRARYFLDPWNNPYWIRHKCNRREKIVRVFVYSFGPNRKRDSTDWELRSDDIGMMIGESGELAAGT